MVCVASEDSFEENTLDGYLEFVKPDMPKS